MWPSTSEKNIPPYLSLLVSLSFSRNNLCKNAVFFLAVSFPKKAFVFPNNRISEARICRQCWFKKISRKRKTKQQKKLRGNVFPLSPTSHAKIELIWTRKKKIRPKKSLTWLLQAALQLTSGGKASFTLKQTVWYIRGVHVLPQEEEKESHCEFFTYDAR